jgi:hypothetical protein
MNKPRIFRVWNNRTGRFGWACNPMHPGAWGLGVTQHTRDLWRYAEHWCFQLNTRTPPNPAPDTIREILASSNI